MYRYFAKNWYVWFVILLFALACWMRWHTLDVPFDRDSYDEGVYWQSLRSLAQGHTLYGQIFYSQPPAFLLSIFPAYLIFGQSILAARIGIALLSLCGLLGALFVGKVLRGNSGALLALLLLVVSPLYLTESQILQADAPSTALMLLALGLAYLWWKHPVGLAGYTLAILTAIILVLSILSKLFGLADLVPIALLALAHLWRIWEQPVGKRFAYSGSLLAGACALVLTCLFFIVLFSSSFSPLWDQVITFHTAAKAHTTSTIAENLQTLLQALKTPLGLFALYGTLVSLARRDWCVLPLIAWFLAIFYLLWQQLPLLSHHLVTLVPPLVLLAAMSLSPFPVMRRPSHLQENLLQYPKTDRRNGEKPLLLPHTNNSKEMMPKMSNIFVVGNSIAIIALCLTMLYFEPMIMNTYQEAQQQANGMDAQTSLQVAHDVDTVTQPDQLVITDAQFLVAEANRSTPPQLVDTSFVRIQSGYLSNEQLTQLAEQSSVHAILFYTGRLYQQKAFYRWVSQHFHEVRDYGGGRELWAKIK